MIRSEAIFLPREFYDILVDLIYFFVCFRRNSIVF